MLTMMEYLKTYEGPFRWINSDLLRLDKKSFQTNCPNCGAPVYRNMMKCEYCGTDKREEHQ